MGASQRSYVVMKVEGLEEAVLWPRLRSGFMSDSWSVTRTTIRSDDKPCRDHEENNVVIFFHSDKCLIRGFS